ncbi:MAG: hypothetical protein ACI9D0_001327 [Bacteroidia bacterium]|jgi:hypothetical protein
MDALPLEVLPGTLAVLRFESGADIPAWTRVDGSLWASLQTADELTVVCQETGATRTEIDKLPEACRQGDWSALRVSGVLDFSLTGILAGLSGALAEAEVSIFALSTFDTDYILVQRTDLAVALEALRGAGHTVAE